MNKLLFKENLNILLFPILLFQVFIYFIDDILSLSAINRPEANLCPFNIWCSLEEFLLTVFVAPFFEELIFRVFLPLSVTFFLFLFLNFKLNYIFNDWKKLLKTPSDKMGSYTEKWLNIREEGLNSENKLLFISIMIIWAISNIIWAGLHVNYGDLKFFPTFLGGIFYSLAFLWYGFKGSFFLHLIYNSVILIQFPLGLFLEIVKIQNGAFEILIVYSTIFLYQYLFSIILLMILERNDRKKSKIVKRTKNKSEC